MLSSFTDSLMLAGHPAAWAALGILVVIMFAPNLLPMLARLAGRLLQGEVWRRLGAFGISQPARNPQKPRPVEVIQPPPVRTQSSPSHAPDIIEAEIIPTRRRKMGIWPVAALVLIALAVLSWILFHQR